MLYAQAEDLLQGGVKLPWKVLDPTIHRRTAEINFAGVSAFAGDSRLHK
jgi:hypothetical protein